MNKEELKIIVDQLIELGEDKDELEYWLNIFDDMPQQKQEALSKNLQKELEQLSKIQQ